MKQLQPYPNMRQKLLLGHVDFHFVVKRLWWRLTDRWAMTVLSWYMISEKVFDCVFLRCNVREGIYRKMVILRSQLVYYQFLKSVNMFHFNKSWFWKSETLCTLCYKMEKLQINSKDLGLVAGSLVSANCWLRGIKTFWFPWYLTAVSANHASSNPVLEAYTMYLRIFIFFILTFKLFPRLEP